MNIALPAIVLFLILLPGFIARSRFKRVERTVIDYSPFGYAVAEGVLWAVILHLIWLTGTVLLTDYVFLPEKMLPLFSPNNTKEAALVDIGQHFTPIARYFLTLLLAAFAVPTLGRNLITKYHWDAYDHPLSRMLKFNGAPWYYLLSGADFPPKDPKNQPDMISISAIVDIAGDAYLYVGLLEHFFVNNEGNLDRLILSEVIRRPLAKDKDPLQASTVNERFYPVDGDYFVLRYSEAITLNVEYIKL